MPGRVALRKAARSSTRLKSDGSAGDLMSGPPPDSPIEDNQPIQDGSDSPTRQSQKKRLKNLGGLIVIGLCLPLHSFVTLGWSGLIGARDPNGPRAFDEQGRDVTDNRWPFEIAVDRAICTLFRLEHDAPVAVAPAEDTIYTDATAHMRPSR